MLSELAKKAHFFYTIEAINVYYIYMEETTQSKAGGKFWLWLILIFIPVGIIAFAVTQKQSQFFSQQSNTTGAIAGKNSTPLPVGYKDGSFTAVGSYMSPGGNELLGVTLTLSNGIITDSTVDLKADRPISLRYQQMFADNYKAEVIGKKIDQLNINKISGSSLTPQGFNDALLKIKAEAKA